MHYNTKKADQREADPPVILLDHRVGKSTVFYGFSHLSEDFLALGFAVAASGGLVPQRQRRYPGQ
ncbi:hypothetical protein ACFL6S_16820 [Candidatus Poribacteria bacterium]